VTFLRLGSLDFTIMTGMPKPLIACRIAMGFRTIDQLRIQSPLRFIRVFSQEQGDEAIFAARPLFCLLNCATVGGEAAFLKYANTFSLAIRYLQELVYLGSSSSGLSKVRGTANDSVAG
jgi:hypothetical protein